jgi:deoxyribodipyrimidine photo-lyase
MKAINVVWMKRDLRTQDHEPLMLAEKAGIPYIIIYCFEPSIINQPDTSTRHLQFQYNSLIQINTKLKSSGRCVEIFWGESLEVLLWLAGQFEIKQLLSYRESGIRLTWERDKKIKTWCSKHSISWTECRRDGIQRGIHNRDGWDKQWFQFMHAPIICNSFTHQVLTVPTHSFIIPDEIQNEWSEYPVDFQPPGEDVAFRYLQTFVDSRGYNYNKHISKPTESRLSCGRISPYLSWGNLSVRQVYRFIMDHPKSISGSRWARGFLTRVKWRDHFIQKFEVECDYETKCINSGYESLVKSDIKQLIEAWENGTTGFPLVDASMRCLIKTGWINFRMRAMLVSFFCHHLYQDWRSGTQYLARLFLDYEPGIHYPQFQMQAGTTGVNTVRIYNPVKQSNDHDPEGVFIKKWVPELSSVDIEFIHEPHRMNEEEQTRFNVRIGIDYPRPIINLETAARHARENIWGHRKKASVQKEGKRILETHVSKRISKTAKKKGGQQLTVF